MLFGFKFRTPDPAPPPPMKMVMQMGHPPGTPPDGRDIREIFTNVIKHDWSCHGYSLDKSWTFVPGTRRFTVKPGDLRPTTRTLDLKVALGQTPKLAECAPPTA